MRVELRKAQASAVQPREARFLGAFSGSPQVADAELVPCTLARARFLLFALPYVGPGDTAVAATFDLNGAADASVRVTLFDGAPGHHRDVWGESVAFRLDDIGEE
jgi:hypothetical protein